MHLHVLGLGGTFMSGLAVLAREARFHVTGCDLNCYPPVSDLLLEHGIAWENGYDDAKLALQADLILVGNAMKRGMPVIEAMLNARKPYVSGPQWLAETILSRYRVVAVSGTHGKTTTTSMLAHILECAGMHPGFLIGGVATNFATNARLGSGDWFVVEADEYDSAFFDKRPKFMHYRPEVAVMTNLEFDHADIYTDLPAIQRQFEYFTRTIPSNGLIVHRADEPALDAVLASHAYTAKQRFGLTTAAEWSAQLQDDGVFDVCFLNQPVARVQWSILGEFNIENALAAIASSVRMGVEPEVAANALAHFLPVKRRLEVKSTAFDITVYDDFAHHPTAIQKTIQALRDSKKHARILVVIEFVSYTMRTGVHGNRVAQALALADAVYALSPSGSSLEALGPWSIEPQVFANTDDIIQALSCTARAHDAIVIMSNRGFDGIHARLIDALKAERG